MVKYYPLTRIRPNLYTRGNQYVRPDGTSYVGRYYLTYDNKAFAGINPVLGTNEPLTLAVVATNNTPISNAYIAASTQNTQNVTAESDVELTQLNSYNPVPVASDYARGYFTRYFAKNVTGPQFIIEISQTDFAQLQNGNVSPKMLSYQSTSMLWQLTGPLKDTRISQYQIQGGVFDTNKRVTEAKQVGFYGIVEFIGGDYVKFAKITP